MKIHTYIFLIILLTTACTERIDVEIDSDYTRFVVEGAITTDTMVHTIKLSASGDYLMDVATPRINDADVFVVSDNDTIYYRKMDDDGLYGSSSAFYGVEGKTYQLFVRGIDINEDGTEEEYTAISTMPNSGVVDSISLGHNVESGSWVVNLWAQEPPEANWYIFKAGVNNVLKTDTITEWFLQEDELFNGNYTYGIFVQFLSGKGDEEVNLFDTVFLELHSVTKEYYSFVEELQGEVFGSNPLFGGPPANIVGNISNGALGFFSTEVIVRTSKRVRAIPKESTDNFGPG